MKNVYLKAHVTAWVLLAAVCASAQIVKVDSLSPWRKSFRAGLNLNQAAFSSNWKAGGVNSIGFNALLNYKANYKKGKNSWDNEVDFLYGMVNNQGQGYRKMLDRLYIDTKYGREINAKWSFASSLNLLSQFANGFQFEKDAAGVERPILISDFFAPAFITSAWGLEYHPNNAFKVRLSPFSPRITVVTDNNGRFAAVDPVRPYGVLVGETARYEWFAFQMVAEFDKDIARNMNLKWRYLMFANYETLSPETIDHRLDLNLTAKVNKFISVNLATILLYDIDQDAGLQSSQAFSLGVLYTFQNFTP
jgi:hypothetical protein